MKRAFFLPAMIVFSGCALLRPLPPDQNPELRDVPQPSNVVVLPKDTRVPNKTGRVYWVPEAKVLRVTGPRGAMFGFKLDLESVNEWTEPVSRAVPPSQIRAVASEQTQCKTWSCGDTRPTGIASAWMGFSKAKSTDRARIISSAVQGLNPEDAQALAQAKWFRSEPTTWDELTTALERAAKEKRIPASSVQNAIVDFKERNLGALGYAMGTCGLKAFPCTVFKKEIDTQAKVENSMRILRLPIEKDTRRFEVVVRNPQLQSFEDEAVTVVAGKERDDVRVVVDGPTVYQMQMSHADKVTRIEMTGIDRLRSELPVHALKSIAFDQQGRDPELHVAIDPRYLADEAAGDRLVLRYKVQTCPAWGNICSSEWTDQNARFVQLSSANLKLPIELERGRRAKVLVSLARLNSKFYNDSFLRDRETDSIRVK